MERGRRMRRRNAVLKNLMTPQYQQRRKEGKHRDDENYDNLYDWLEDVKDGEELCEGDRV